jgi:hypothetical protein
MKSGEFLDQLSDHQLLKNSKGLTKKYVTILTKLSFKQYLENLGVDGRIILKWILEKLIVKK